MSATRVLHVSIQARFRLRKWQHPHSNSHCLRNPWRHPQLTRTSKTTRCLTCQRIGSRLAPTMLPSLLQLSHLHPWHGREQQGQDSCLELLEAQPISLRHLQLPRRSLLCTLQLLVALLPRWKERHLRPMELAFQLRVPRAHSQCWARLPLPRLLEAPPDRHQTARQWRLLLPAHPARRAPLRR